MDVELVDRYGITTKAELTYGGDEVEFESGQSVTISALLLLGFTIRKVRDSD